MKDKLKYIPLFSLLFLSLLCKSQDYDAEYLDVKKEYKLNDDGSMEYHYSHKLKILSYFAFHRKYGQTSIIYNPEYQEVVVHKAMTTMKDGTKVPVPENGYNVVLPDFAKDAPAYNHLRKFVITHTGLEVGAVVEVDYTVKTRKGYYPFLMYSGGLRMSSPVKNMRQTVSVPEGSQLVIKEYDKGMPEILPDSLKQNNRISLTASDLPAIGLEGSCPHPSGYDHYVSFSTAPDLRSVYKYFVGQDAFRYVLGSETKEFIKNYREKYSDDLKLIVELQAYFARYVKTYHIPFEYTGYRLTYPDYVFLNNGGTTFEKATLFSALLQQLGIKAFPVMLAPSVLANREIGDLNIFNEFMVRIYTSSGEFIYLPMDVVADQNLLYDLDGRTVVPIYAVMKSVEFREEGSYDNEMTMTGSFRFDDELNLKGRVSTSFTNALNPYYRIVRDSNKMVNGLFSGLYSIGEENIFAEYGQEASSLDFDAVFNPSVVKSQEKLMIVSLPEYDLGYKALHMPYVGARRTEPVEICRSVNETYNIKIKLDKNLKLLSNSKVIEIKNEVGFVHIELEVKRGSVRIVKSINLKKQIVQPTQLKMLRQIMQAWADDDVNKLLFYKVEN